MAAKNYGDLIAWQKAMDLVEAVYRVSAGFPREEVYCLTNQLRRAAISVASNIAEGQGRGSDREFLRFLSIAHGSLREVETQILIASRLRYVETDRVGPLVELTAEVGRLVTGLANALRRRTPADPLP